MSRNTIDCMVCDSCGKREIAEGDDDPNGWTWVNQAGSEVSGDFCPSCSVPIADLVKQIKRGKVE